MNKKTEFTKLVIKCLTELKPNETITFLKKNYEFKSLKELRTHIIKVRWQYLKDIVVQTESIYGLGGVRVKRIK